MSKPLEENGIHRARLWEIGFYALNNTSTNVYMMLVAYMSYFLIGIVGLGAVLAGSILTIMRIWDGVTDPIVGFIVDKTNGRFGKNRPFIVIGNVILFVMTWLMYHIIPTMPTGARFPIFIIMYMVYIIGYTFQCVVTKSAQTCLTNDPAQRPIFAMFDTVYNILLMSMMIPVYVTDTLVPKFTLNMATSADEINALVAKNPNLANCITNTNGNEILSAFYNPNMFVEMQYTLGAVAAVFAVMAIIGIWRKDNSKYYGTGKVVKVGLRDYADTLAHNRAIQMLVVSASTDKLFMSMKSNSTVMICLFGVVCGNYAMYSSFSQLTSVPTAIISLLGFNFIARKLGQKMSMVVGTWGGIIGAVVLILMFIFGNPASMSLPAFRLTNPATWGLLFQDWSGFGILFVVLSIVWAGVTSLSSSIVITMTADCADYEVYRTGKYVPGLMGTLFSFVDKLVSSFATTIVAAVFAAAGFATALPTVESPYTTGLLIATLFCYFGAPIIGWLCNVVAMKFYPLTKEKMAEIQLEIARIKAETANESIAAENAVTEDV